MITKQRIYSNIKLGLLLVGGSDLYWMDKVMRAKALELPQRQRQTLLQIWASVRARLRRKGYQ